MAVVVLPTPPFWFVTAMVRDMVAYCRSGSAIAPLAELFWWSASRLPRSGLEMLPLPFPTRRERSPGPLALVDESIGDRERWRSAIDCHDQNVPRGTFSTLSAKRPPNSVAQLHEHFLQLLNAGEHSTGRSRLPKLLVAADRWATPSRFASRLERERR